MNWIKKIGLHQRGIWLDILAITFGAFLMASGIGIFLVDAKVVPGGVSGLAMDVHYISAGRIPVGLVMWILNIPLFIWGVKELGRQFGTRTFVGFTMSSFFIDLLRGRIPGMNFLTLHTHPAVTSFRQTDFLFTILVGAVLLGIGLGIIFKFRGSTAGSDILAAVARKRWGIKPGTAFLFVDTVVIIITGIVIHYKNLPHEKPILALLLYALFVVFISSRIVDTIIDGFDYARSAFIISSETEKISQVILNDLSRGATALEARGLYKNEPREVLYCVVSRKEIGLLLDTVKKIDPHAFVIVNDVHEVLGEGFRPRI
ncbi:YitT family protein [candidate division KSB1 bacterium]|nr:YitT family protein [candidate division KSB1 bacterium]